MLHEVVNRGLSTQPRDYVPKKAPTRPAQEGAKSCSALGLAHPVVQLEGFLLLANTRNHCYANSSLQCLYWLLPSIRDSLMQEAQRVSQLVRITSEHTSLVHITSGWLFDGRQHDAAEFLHKILGNLHPLSLGYWETRKSVPEGIRNEEGNSPIHIDSQVCSTAQQMLDLWAGQDTARALILDSENVCIALPRFTGGPKNADPIELSDQLSIPFFPDHTDTVSWATYSLEALIIHQGSEATSGHYRAVVRKGSAWHIGDDARPPKECLLSDACIQTESYVLFLKRSGS